jgi:hypothetical protein
MWDGAAAAKEWRTNRPGSFGKIGTKTEKTGGGAFGPFRRGILPARDIGGGFVARMGMGRLCFIGLEKNGRLGGVLSRFFPRAGMIGPGQKRPVRLVTHKGGGLARQKQVKLT